MHQIQQTQLLRDLYREQLHLRHDEYLYLQSRSDSGIQRRVDAFNKYKTYLTPGRILDWGCKHSVDGCLIRHMLGQQVTIVGCDTCEGDFEVFHKFASLKYTKLTHPYLLPYENEEFDFVISSGVLEHVPNDSESMKEIYRVLKPGGMFVITFLPNRLSYTENLVGLLKGPNHKRPYSIHEVKQMLLHHGFIPRLNTYHQMIPSFSSLGSNGVGGYKLLQSIIQFMLPFNGFLEQVWVMRSFASNLMFVAEKVSQL